MPDYRRWYVPGGTYFFALVTYRRHRLFQSPLARQILGEVLREIRAEQPFDVVAMVLLYDHLHTVWTLSRGDADYSTRWKRLKASFTRRWLQAGGQEFPISASRKARGERGIWQRRFWEHTELEEADLEAHVDYIHYNPVKHGYVQRACDWPLSSFRRYVDLGQYDANWGSVEPESILGVELE